MQKNPQKKYPSFISNLPSLHDPTVVTVSGQPYPLPMPYQTNPGFCQFQKHDYSRYVDTNFTTTQLLYTKGAIKDNVQWTRNPNHAHALLVRKGCASFKKQWKTADYTAHFRQSCKKSPSYIKLIEKEQDIIGKPKSYLKKAINDSKIWSKLDMWKVLRINPQKHKNHQTAFGFTKRGGFTKLNIVHLLKNGEEKDLMHKLFQRFLRRELWGMSPSSSNNKKRYIYF